MVTYENNHTNYYDTIRQQEAEKNTQTARQAVQVAQNNLVQIRQTLGQQVETAKQALRNTETRRAQAEDASPKPNNKKL